MLVKVHVCIFEENGTDLFFLICQSKSAFVAQTIKNGTELFAVADIRPRDSSVSSGEGCVNISRISAAEAMFIFFLITKKKST